MKIQIIRKNDGTAYWRIVAANQKVLAHSEIYTRTSKAWKTVLRVVEEIGEGCIIEEVEG